MTYCLPLNILLAESQISIEVVYSLDHDHGLYPLTSLRKTVGKVSPILVTLTSRSDSNIERSHISLKENKRDGVDPNSDGFDYYVRKNEGKFYCFRQTVTFLT